MNDIKTVSVIGLGYIGLPTAATLANAGFDVLGVDVHPDIVETINSGNIHINEQGLDILVRAAVQRGKLRAAVEPQPTDAYIIAVPTPIQADKAPDLSYVETATSTICRVLKPGDLVVVESTIPPRTCVDVVGPLIAKLTGLRHDTDYHLAHCPERVIPGKILHEIIYNDRIIGGTTPEATQRTTELYASFVKGQCLATDALTAETCKLMENTFRDVNIALANEFASIAEVIGIDVYEAIKLTNRHPRVNIHTPGIGVGGHCIPIDPWFIAHAAPDSARLIRLAREINDEKPKRVAERILTIMQQNPGKRVALLGLSYKPDVDDLRESPAVEIAREVAASTSDDICLVEPHIRRLPERLSVLPNIKLVSVQTAYAEASLLIILVKHKQFESLGKEQISKEHKFIDASKTEKLEQLAFASYSM